MRGVILAGGTGSRLSPLTKTVNKHLLAVGRKPMIYYSIEKLVEAGIKNILVVTGREHMGGVLELLGSGSEFGCDFTYKVQDQAGGIAQALYLAKDFVQQESCCVILGDNIFQDTLSKDVAIFKKQRKGARVLLKEVEDPERFGVAELNGKHIVSIEEKPKRPKSKYAVTGIYFYDASVFEIIKTLKPSGRGELEVTDVNNAYIKNNQLTYGILDGWWSDAGTFESLHRVNQLLS